MKCQALIRKRYKTAKADSVQPLWHGMPNVHAAGLTEVCGGEITIKMWIGGSCSCCGYSPKFSVVAECSVCKWPWTPRLEEVKAWDGRSEIDITQFLEDK